MALTICLTDNNTCGQISAGVTDVDGAAGAVGVAGIAATRATGAIGAVISGARARPPTIALPVVGLDGAGGNAVMPFSLRSRTVSSSICKRVMRVPIESSRAGEANRTTATSNNNLGSGAWRMSTSAVPRTSIARTVIAAPRRSA